MVRHVSAATLVATGLLLLWLLPAAAQAAAPPTYGERLGSHSMLYLNSTPAQQEALFRATSEAGLRYLRMDFAIGMVFRWDGTDFSAVERVDDLAARYRVRVLAVITETPWFISGCPEAPFHLLSRCAPAPEHEATWRDMVSRVVRRAPNIRHWELGNEPDDPNTFLGSPSDYTRWASLAAEGIRAAQPRARIATGGFSRLDARFISPLLGQFDIANVHLRGPLRVLRRMAVRARAFYRKLGFDGRLWVTETGYPSRPEHQWDPAMRGGDADQARWMLNGPRRLLVGGADVAFVAFRDSPEFGPDSPYASEGVVVWPELGTGGRALLKPAYWSLFQLAATPLPAP
jgi:hypothetical protein